LTANPISLSTRHREDHRLEWATQPSLLAMPAG
jgi:hypothetical protein